MAQRASIATQLRDLDERSPAGFAIALHIRFTTPTYMFQTYAKRWLDHYTAAGMLIRDPVVRWGMQNSGRVRWTELEAIDGQGVLEEAKDYGLMNGVAIAVVGSGSRSIGGFARADREYDDDEMEALEEGLERLHRETIGIGQLSERDRDALRELSVRLTH